MQGFKNKTVSLDEDMIQEVETFAQTEGFTFSSGKSNFSGAMNEAARRGIQGIKRFSVDELMTALQQKVGGAKIVVKWGEHSQFTLTENE